MHNEYIIDSHTNPSGEITISPVSGNNYYLSNTQDASFTFSVSGWPLADVTIITHYDKKESEDSKTKNGVTDNDTEKSNDVFSNEADVRSEENAGDLFTLTRTDEYTAVSRCYVELIYDSCICLRPIF